MVADILLEMGFYLERWQEIEEFEDEIRHLGNYIRNNLWDEKTGFLYDQFADGSLSTTQGIGAFWALHTDALDSAQVSRLVSALDDPATFNRPHRVPSLAASNAKYNPRGRYWQGGVWPGTNYMVVTGLDRKGYTAQAKDIAANHFNQVLEVYKQTGTFWEYYAPEATEPGFMARRDFVGWTGLPPIAVFIEYILGIRADFSAGKILWDVSQTEAHGLERLPFGPEGSVSLYAKKRNDAAGRPSVRIVTDVAFDLTLSWGKGQTHTLHVAPGDHSY
jgi:glycogen debranching enzyme